MVGADVQELVAAALGMERQGACHQSASLWRTCIRLAPEHPDRASWVISAARNLFAAGQQARAIGLLRRHVRMSPDRPDLQAHLAMLYQRAGAPDHATVVWHCLLEHFPEHPDRRWWLSSAAFSLMELGRLDEAEQHCQSAITAFPTLSDGYRALSSVYERRFDWARALGAIEEALIHSSDEQRASVVAAKSRILSQMGVTSSNDVTPADPGGRSLASVETLMRAAEEAQQQGPSAEALRRWEHCVTAFPGSPEACRGLAAMLRAMGDADGARQLLAEACTRLPSEASLHQALAEACAQLRDMEAARLAWAEAARLAPFSIHRLWAQCAFLGSCGARSEAEALLAARHATGNVLWRGRYEYAKAARELDEALQCLAHLRAAAPGDAALAVAEAELRSWRQDEGDLARAAEVLRGLVSLSPAGVRARALLARVLVLMDQPAAAAAEVAAISPADARKDVAEARLWREAAEGRWPAVQAGWQALAQRFFLPALHLPATDLSLQGDRFTPPARGGIIAVSVVRNELPRLPGFLQHHRRLGVDGFVIIDNGSQDGSAEFLAAEPDVRLYATSASFAQSSFGIRWLNQVIDMHGRGWVLYADADERLVFPGSEQRRLSDLTAYMAARGEQVMSAVMLDLFPSRAGDADAARIWFDPPRLRPSMSCPYVEAAGGARRRLFGTTVTLSKAPLIDAAAGVRYLGSHHVTPARVSGITGAMLHDHLGYLFDRRNLRRLEAEAARAEHSDHAIDRRRMLTTLAGLAGQDLRGPHSLAYEGSQQLVDIGLMTAMPGVGGV